MTIDECKCVTDYMTTHSLSELLFKDIWNHEPLIWLVEVSFYDGSYAFPVIDADEGCTQPSEILSILRKSFPNADILSYEIYAVASPNDDKFYFKLLGSECPSKIAHWSPDTSNGDILFN